MKAPLYANKYGSFESSVRAMVVHMIAVLVAWKMVG
jgi:hypothetical protein